MSILDLIYDKREEVSSIALKYGVNKIRLFGSTARREDNSNSDIDFLVDFDSDRSLFDLIGFKHSLEETFNRKVDVITFDSLHQDIKENVLSEMIEI
jgi:predicted nucleotidyltransferase